MTLIDRKQDKYKDDSYENSFIFTPRVHFDKYSLYAVCFPTEWVIACISIPPLCETYLIHKTEQTFRLVLWILNIFFVINFQSFDNTVISLSQGNNTSMDSFLYNSMWIWMLLLSWVGNWGLVLDAKIAAHIFNHWCKWISSIARNWTAWTACWFFVDLIKVPLFQIHCKYIHLGSKKKEMQQYNMYKNSKIEWQASLSIISTRY